MGKANVNFINLSTLLVKIKIKYIRDHYQKKSIRVTVFLRIYG